MEIILIILLIILIALVVIFGILLLSHRPNADQNTIKNFGDMICENQKNLGALQVNKLREVDGTVKDMYEAMTKRLDFLNKSLGEVHSLAGGIDDLKRVMTNVKTRGILGELQLGAIISDILAPGQYETNIATVPGSSNRVEFAIRLPGADGGGIYLPVDSKFPIETYTELQEARQRGDTISIRELQKLLTLRLKQFAKDIHTKYVSPPHTTDFAIMFLPFESLYLEAINLGLVETLQHDYKINLAGPSTFAAMLNALEMGFKTLALNEQTTQVQNTLIKVKDEFDKFASGLDLTQQRLSQAGAELDKLIGVRTRSIQRALRDVERS
ncbi:MAG: DNA recombination protein RmuC [Clostridiales bacterium]|nr:DNA recombination protein RmuC [Clostridiales bacterium]